MEEVKFERQIEETQSDCEWAIGLAESFLEDYKEYDKEEFENFRFDLWPVLDKCHKSLEELAHQADILYYSYNKGEYND